MRHSYFTVPLIVVLILALAGLACGGDTTPTAAPVVKTATPEVAQPAATSALTEPGPTATPEPAATPEPTAAPAELGDVVEKGGYFLSALAVEDPATPGLFYKAEAGKRLIAVEVVVGNVSGEMVSPNSLGATLLDADGLKYRSELGGRDDELALVSINPGEKVRGWVAFKIPEQAAPAFLDFDLANGISLRTGLAGERKAPQFPSPPAALPSKLGDVVEQSGYSLSCVTVEDPTAPGMFYKPTPGVKLVGVEIVVGNVSAEQFSANSLGAMLVDADGFVYRTELGGRDGELELVDLNPGEKVRGWVAFAIPESATTASIKFEIPGKIIIQAGCTS
jgi:hypothetical protein